MSQAPEPTVEDSSTGAVADLVAIVKPRLRGWLHLGMFPIALLGGLTLVLVAQPGSVRTASIVFTISAALLFGVSAVYHRGTWGPKMSGLLKRFDHSNIYLIIAGTYTPFAVTLLPADQARLLLLVIWGGAIAGVLFRVFWVGAPRWLYTALYLALGWAGIFYGTKRPNPWPRWFGFHEVFHAFTLGGFLTHFVAVTLAVIGYQAAT